MTDKEREELVRRLRESADEVEEFPHPSHCDHLHVAFKVMREAADALSARPERGEPAAPTGGTPSNAHGKILVALRNVVMLHEDDNGRIQRDPVMAEVQHIRNDADQLQRELAASRRAAQGRAPWISVKKRLPSSDDPVLVCYLPALKAGPHGPKRRHWTYHLCRYAGGQWRFLTKKEKTRLSKRVRYWKSINAPARIDAAMAEAQGGGESSLFGDEESRK